MTLEQDDFLCKCRHPDESHVGIPTNATGVEQLGGCKLCNCQQFDLEVE